MANNNDNKILNVPALRFPEFTGEWENITIREACSEFQSGKNIKAEMINDQGLYPVYGGNGLRGFTGSYNHDGDYILIGRQGALCGNVRKVTGKTYVTEHAIAVCASKEHETTFLQHLFQKMRLGQYSDQSAQPGLAVNKLLRLNINVPSKIEQGKIAKILSLIDERITTQNKIIEKLESLIKGIRHNIFKQLRKDVGFNATIGNILSFEQPQRYIVSSAEYSNDCTFTPVLTANKAFILGYTTETDGIYSKGDCIIIDDFTLDCKYVSFPFKVKSSAIKILTAKNKFILRYTYEYLKSLELSTEEHKRHYIAEVQPHSCVLPDENTLKTIALVFENLACKLANEQSLVLILNKQKQYLLSKMFI